MMLNCTYTGIQKFTKHSRKSVCCYYRLFWQVRLKCSNVSERKPNQKAELDTESKLDVERTRTRDRIAQDTG